MKNATEVEARIVKQLETKPYLQINVDPLLHFEASESTLRKALLSLRDKGYAVLYIPRNGTSRIRPIKVLSVPGTTFKTVYDNKEKIQSPDVMV